MARRKISPEIWLAFAFGTVALGVLLAIAVYVPGNSHNPLLVTVSRVILAVACAGIAAVIPGFLQLELKHSAATAIRAGGALAVFALVYLTNPPELIERKVVEIETGPPPAMDYMPVVDEWIRDIDSGRFAEAHVKAAETARTTYPLATFANIMNSYLSPLGSVVDRQLLGAQGFDRLGDERGHFRVVNFITEFETGGKRAERVLVKAEDGEWKVLEHAYFPVAP